MGVSQDAGRVLEPEVIARRVLGRDRPTLSPNSGEVEPALATLCAACQEYGTDAHVRQDAPLGLANMQRTERIGMTLLALTLIALTAGALVGFAAWRYPPSREGEGRVEPSRPAPAIAAAEVVGHELARHRRLLDMIERRLDPGAATGLALTIALGAVFVGGLLLGLLAYLMRTSAALNELDASASTWAAEHTGDVSERWVSLITHLGATWVVIVLAAVIAIVVSIRRPNRWIFPFLLLVIAGQSLFTNGIKELLDRARPTFNPIAETLGPSFPSGHSATAAAFWAAAALVLGRGRGDVVRPLLAGGAAAIAVAVACSRVFLNVHWLSDVVAGLVLGWAWFAVCAIAFGGRILEFGLAARVAEDVADKDVARGSESDRR
jgi:membrane-associated phospholipid phosphatase